MTRQTGNAKIMASPFVTTMEEIDNLVNGLAMAVYLQLVVSCGPLLKYCGGMGIVACSIDVTNLHAHFAMHCAESYLHRFAEAVPQIRYFAAPCNAQAVDCRG